MIETKKVPKNLYDLARALSRWESEGGAEEPLQASVFGADVEIPEAFQQDLLEVRHTDFSYRWAGEVMFHCSRRSNERSGRADGGIGDRTCFRKLEDPAEQSAAGDGAGDVRQELQS